jgi:enamine deaminase RidA (YjgF/YER057c/UK114 family)
MTGRVVVSGIQVGGTEPLIASATRWRDLLFLSGCAPVDPATLQLVSNEFDAQARAVLDGIVSTLEEAGSGIEHVLRVVCYLADARDFEAWNRLWAATFPPPRPARTTVVTGFVVPRMLIEVEVTAGIPAANE